MAGGIWVSPDEFVVLSEPQKSLTVQIASRSRTIDFYKLGMYLSNPDPILKAQRQDIRIYRELRTDPLVGGYIRRHKAALKPPERGLERGYASTRVFRFIHDMFDDLDLSRIIDEMSDAVLYGYQPCEVVWGRPVRAWAVTDVVGKPPGWSQFDTDNYLHFQTRGTGVEGELPSPSKLVASTQDASYDNPYGSPDLPMCFWPVAFEKGGMKFWLRFAEEFGSLWAIGKHPRGANDTEIEKLLDFMEQIVGDAVAATLNDSNIELKAVDSKVDSSEIFHELVTLSRNEVSIALLGQSQTTGASSNRASAQAGLEVTTDIRDADVNIIQTAVNQVIGTMVALNFDDVPCPVRAIWEQETIDGTRATRNEKLTRVDLRLTPQYLKHEYQLQGDDIGKTPPSERQNSMLLLSFTKAVDVGIQAQQQLDDALDILMDGGVLNGTLEPVLVPLFKRVESEISPTELLGELAEFYPQMNTDDLQERLAHILFVASIWGRLHERDDG